ncbi:hypothetical protein M0638_26890 [Roseomonas sp. NAR14]|uniref:Uncharacterized protein n=1 Tax=Roseomonas acroporae TaxID=2937791 RepID=A0A9X1YDV9_9PROT|nr:hypothetical protein [Roseomonas acroporae]MCK8787987.1 hypothetical protein [Roseomonas acroporae]
MSEPTTIPTHPEEVTASVDLRLGSSVSVQARARATPAGLIAAGILAAAVILAIVPLVRAARR